MSDKTNKVPLPILTKQSKICSLFLLLLLMPLELNTIITICSFLISVGIQISVLAYYAGRFSQMVKRLEEDLKEHKQDSMDKHVSLQQKLEKIEKDKQEEHSKFNERLGKHDIIMENIEKNLSEMKDSIKEIANDLKLRRK